MRTRWGLVLLVVAAMGCRRKEPAYLGPWVIEEEGGAQIAAADASMSATAASAELPVSPATAEVPADSAMPSDAVVSAETPSVDAGSEAITDARVDVEFGECFGDCPVYALHFKSDGTLTGPGGARKLSDERTQGILRLFDDAFAKPIARCPRPTDVQHVKVTYVRGKKARSTEYWTGQPCPSKVVDAVKRLNALRGR